MSYMNNYDLFNQFKDKISSAINQGWKWRWKDIGLLNDLTANNFKKYSGKIGLYKLIQNNKLIYVGKAVEYDNRGFSKRLMDYTRKSDSARKNETAQYINNNKSNIKVCILALGDSEQDVKYINLLEELMIEELKPKLNYKDKN